MMGHKNYSFGGEKNHQIWRYICTTYLVRGNRLCEFSYVQIQIDVSDFVQQYFRFESILFWLTNLREKLFGCFSKTPVNCFIEAIIYFKSRKQHKYSYQSLKTHTAEERIKANKLFTNFLVSQECIKSTYP